MMASFHVVLRAHFSTRHEEDVQNMPPQNKHILGVTSLWMAILICYGTFQRSGNDGMAMLVIACHVVDGCVSGFDPVLV